MSKENKLDKTKPKNGSFNLEAAGEKKPVNLSAEDSKSILQHLKNNLKNFEVEETGFSPLDKNLCPEEGDDFNIPKNLPVLTTQALSQEPLEAVKWSQIKNLPNFYSAAIRTIGKNIFGAFKCFEAFSEYAEEKGVDGLGEILVVNDYTHDQATTQALAKTIVQYGTPVQYGTVDHSKFIGGDYAPEILVLMTDQWTFKLVRETPENGAPVNLNSIYAWPGGLDFYKKQAQLEAKSDNILKTSTELE